MEGGRELSSGKATTRAKVRSLQSEWHKRPTGCGSSSQEKLRHSLPFTGVLRHLRGEQESRRPVTAGSRQLVQQDIFREHQTAPSSCLCLHLVPHSCPSRKAQNYGSPQRRTRGVEYQRLGNGAASLLYPRFLPCAAGSVRIPVFTSLFLYLDLASPKSVGSVQLLFYSALSTH